MTNGYELEAPIVERTDDFIKVDFYGMPMTYYYHQIEAIDNHPVVIPKKDPPEEKGQSTLIDEVRQGVVIVKSFPSEPTFSVRHGFCRLNGRLDNHKLSFDF